VSINSAAIAEVIRFGFFVSRNSKTNRVTSESGQKFENFSEIIWQMLKPQPNSELYPRPKKVVQGHLIKVMVNQLLGEDLGCIHLENIFKPAIQD